jgi:hypothetical protein
MESSVVANPSSEFMRDGNHQLTVLQRDNKNQPAWLQGIRTWVNGKGAINFVTRACNIARSATSKDRSNNGILKIVEKETGEATAATPAGGSSTSNGSWWVSKWCS